MTRRRTRHPHRPLRCRCGRHALRTWLYRHTPCETDPAERRRRIRTCARCQPEPAAGWAACGCCLIPHPDDMLADLDDTLAELFAALGV